MFFCCAGCWRCGFLCRARQDFLLEESLRGCAGEDRRRPGFWVKLPIAEAQVSCAANLKGGE